LIYFAVESNLKLDKKQAAIMELKEHNQVVSQFQLF